MSSGGLVLAAIAQAGADAPSAPIDWQTLVLALAAAVAGAAQIWRQTRHSSLDDVKRLLEIHDALPEGSPARHTVIGHVESEIAGYVERSQEHRRDWGGVLVAGIIFALAGGGVQVALRGGLWSVAWIAVVFFALLGVVGLAVSLPKRQRDESGRRA